MDTATRVGDLPTWTSQCRQLQLMRRLAPHLFKARERAACMIEVCCDGVGVCFPSSGSVFK